MEQAMPGWKKRLRQKIEAGYWRTVQNEVMGPIVEALFDEAFYDPPPGFEKPKSYPKITSVFGGTKWKAAMGKGFVDLGLIDPDKPPANVERVRSSILRSVVKLLIASKGDNAFIRDPEAVLPKVLGHIKVNLKANLEEALEAMYDKPIAVTVAGVKTKKGVPGWRISAHGLAAHVPDA